MIFSFNLSGLSSSSPSPGQHHGYVVVPTSPQQSCSASSGAKKIILSSAGTKRPPILTAQPLRQPARQLSKSVERDVSNLPQCVSPPSSSNLSSPSSTSYQIDAILNSNIRIQPKPGADVKVSTGTDEIEFKDRKKSFWKLKVWDLFSGFEIFHIFKLQL